MVSRKIDLPWTIFSIFVFLLKKDENKKEIWIWIPVKNKVFFGMEN